jgi:hypothetical protein
MFLSEELGETHIQKLTTKVFQAREGRYQKHIGHHSGSKYRSTKQSPEKSFDIQCNKSEGE